jgi:hypothetical protein
MPIIPLAYNTVIRLVHPSVQGWRDNLRDSRQLAGLRLAAPGQAQ